MKLKEILKVLVVLVSSLLFLSGCSGINVYTSGSNNSITINLDREGGATVDVDPITKWGNVE